MHSLTDIMDSRTTKLGPGDRAWKTFIQDHIQYIRSKSTAVSVTENHANRLQDNISQMLSEMGCDQKIIWVAKLINRIDLRSILNVDDIVLIPDTSLLSSMYSKFNTSRKVT